MKGNFKANPYLMMLGDTLKDKDTLVFVNVSTTGLDNADCMLHSPTRVCVQEYSFDEEIGAYIPKLTFDKMVEATPEGIKHALDNLDKYDVFKNGGINAREYLNGTNVLSVEDFQKEYHFFMESFNTDNTLIIANNTDFCINYLNKIGCGTELDNANKIDRVIDQTKLTSEYLTEKGIKGKRTLEDLRNHLENRNDDASKERIIGGDNRIKVMFDFVEKFGRESRILDGEYSVYFSERNRETYESFVQRGKEKYQESGLEDKFKTLIAKGTISEDVVDRSYPCDMNDLFDVLEGKTDKKGLIVMQTATTGFTAGNAPIQFTAIVYDMEQDGLVGRKMLSMDIKADSKSLNLAIQEKNNGKFDAFAYTGINLDDYMAGKSSVSKEVNTEEMAVRKINAFFKEFSFKDYALVSNGKAKNSDMSFSQKALEGLGNMAMLNEPYIDCSQVIKEYLYKCMETGKECGILDLDKIDGKAFTFSLENMAMANDLGDLKGTQDRCVATINLIDMIDNDLRKEREMAMEEKPKEPSVVKVQTEQSIHSPMGMGSIGGVSLGIEKEDVKETPYDYQSEESEADFADEDYGDYFQLPRENDLGFEMPIHSSNGIQMGSAQILSEEELAVTMGDEEYSSRPLLNTERELYSSKKNDSLSVVEVDGNIRKVGDMPIKHISEAVQPTKVEQPTKAEQPTQTQSNVDLSELVKALTDQTKAMQENTMMLQKQNEMLVNQNETLSKILVATIEMVKGEFAKDTKEITNEPKEFNLDSNASRMVALDVIQDDIVSVMNKIDNANTRKNLHIANSYISKAQKEMDKMDKTIEQKGKV